MRKLQTTIVALLATFASAMALGQGSAYSLAPTMNAPASIMGWKDSSDARSTAAKFRIGMLSRSEGVQVSERERGRPRFAPTNPAQIAAPAQLANPTRLKLPTVTVPRVAKAQLGMPSRKQVNSDANRLADRQVLKAQGATRLTNQNITNPSQQPTLTLPSAQTRGIMSEDLEQSPSDILPPPTDVAAEDSAEEAAIETAPLPPGATTESAPVPPTEPTEVAPAPPEIIRTQRLPRVEQPKPQRLPFIIGESAGQGPSLFDAYRLPNVDNEPHDPIVITPDPPQEIPKVEAEITGIAIPDLPPVTHSAPTAPKPDLGVDPAPAEVSDYAIASPNYDRASLNDLKKQSYDVAELNIRRDGLWWNVHAQKQLLRFDHTRRMTLPDAFRAALRFSPELVALTAEVDSRGYDVVQRDAAFDWTVFVESIWAHNDDPVGDALAGAANRLEVNDYGTTAGGRKLNRFGGNLEVSHRSGFLDSNSSFFTPPNQANGRLAVDLTQPLLRGAGRTVNNSTIALARMAHQVSVEELQTGIEVQLQSVANAYWNLFNARSRFLQSRAAWHRAHALLDIVEKRQQIDAGMDNLNRIRSATASRYSQTVAAEYDVVRAQEALLRQMFGSNYANQQGFELVTTTLPPDTTVPSEVNVDVDTALANRPEIRRALRLINTAAIEHDVAENQLLPVLNVVLSTYSASLRGNKDFGGAFRDHFSDSNPGISGALNYEMPVHNRAASARERQTVANIKRFEADLQSVAADVALEIRDRWLAVAQAATDLKLQQNALVSAHEDLDYVDARKRYLADGAGFTDLYLDNLLRAQDRLQAAENSLLQAQVNHGAALIDLGRAKGVLRETIIGPPNVQSFEEPQIVR